MLNKNLKNVKYIISFILLLSILIAGFFFTKSISIKATEKENIKIQAIPEVQKVSSILSNENNKDLNSQIPEIIKDITILVYHSVSPMPTDRKESLLQKRFRIDPDNFRSQMQYLKDNNYTPITFNHLALYLLENKEIPEKPVVITFDDGLLNQYEYAIPILKEFNFVATFFIYPGVTAHKNFMNWEQLMKVVEYGHEISSHTIIHYNLTKIDDDTLHNELVESKKILEEKLGISVTTFAYPHYAENENVRNAVQDAGYIAARAGWRNIKNSVDEILHLKAQEAGNTKNPFTMPR